MPSLHVVEPVHVPLVPAPHWPYNATGPPLALGVGDGAATDAAACDVETASGATLDDAAACDVETASGAGLDDAAACDVETAKGARIDDAAGPSPSDFKRSSTKSRPVPVVLAATEGSP